MVTFKRLMAVALLIALAAAGVWYFMFYRSDEAVIGRRIDKFETLLTKSPGSGGSAEALANLQLSGMIADGCEVREIHPLIDGVYSPTAFASLVSQGHAACDRIEVEFDHEDIKLTAPASATITLEASVEAKLKGGDKQEDNRDLIIKMKKVDDDWKIASITAPPMLKD
ncbi:MAG: hypothetical protein AB7F40_01975 [Victivallaceae bacterium]|nr:hypothetical protein [Victivallaceae bacterium]